MEFDGGYGGLTGARLAAVGRARLKKSLLWKLQAIFTNRENSANESLSIHFLAVHANPCPALWAEIESPVVVLRPRRVTLFNAQGHPRTCLTPHREHWLAPRIQVQPYPGFPVFSIQMKKGKVLKNADYEALVVDVFPTKGAPPLRCFKGPVSEGQGRHSGRHPCPNTRSPVRPGSAVQSRGRGLPAPFALSRGREWRERQGRRSTKPAKLAITTTTVCFIRSALPRSPLGRVCSTLSTRCRVLGRTGAVGAHPCGKSRAGLRPDRTP